MEELGKKVPTIDLSDITDKDGKLNVIGCILFIGVCFVALNKFIDLYVTDKMNSN